MLCILFFYHPAHSGLNKIGSTVFNKKDKTYSQILYRTNVVASSITAKQPPFNSIFLSFGDCHAAENPSAARNDIV
jgi:hypothetical protein